MEQLKTGVMNQHNKQRDIQQESQSGRVEIIST